MEINFILFNLMEIFNIIASLFSFIRYFKTGQIEILEGPCSFFLCFQNCAILAWGSISKIEVFNNILYSGLSLIFLYSSLIITKNYASIIYNTTIILNSAWMMANSSKNMAFYIFSLGIILNCLGHPSYKLFKIVTDANLNFISIYQVNFHIIQCVCCFLYFFYEGFFYLGILNIIAILINFLLIRNYYELCNLEDLNKSHNINQEKKFKKD